MRGTKAPACRERGVRAGRGSDGGGERGGDGARRGGSAAEELEPRLLVEGELALALLLAQVAGGEREGAALVLAQR